MRAAAGAGAAGPGKGAAAPSGGSGKGGPAKGAATPSGSGKGAAAPSGGKGGSGKGGSGKGGSGSGGGPHKKARGAPLLVALAASVQAAAKKLGKWRAAVATRALDVELVMVRCLGAVGGLRRGRCMRPCGHARRVGAMRNAPTRPQEAQLKGRSPDITLVPDSAFDARAAAAAQATAGGGGGASSGGGSQAGAPAAAGAPGGVVLPERWLLGALAPGVPAGALARGALAAAVAEHSGRGGGSKGEGAEVDEYEAAINELQRAGYSISSGGMPSLKQPELGQKSQSYGSMGPGYMLSRAWVAVPPGGGGGGGVGAAGGSGGGGPEGSSSRSGGDATFKVVSWNILATSGLGGLRARPLACGRPAAPP